jgi:hypothetical protein
MTGAVQRLFHLETLDTALGLRSDYCCLYFLRSPFESPHRFFGHYAPFVAVRIVRRALYNSAGHATRSND